jgi:hypothetical protein
VDRRQPHGLDPRLSTDRSQPVRLAAGRLHHWRPAGDDADPDQLILELAILNDQKTSKIIELLEEARRDNPAIVDRVDPEASAMSSPSDTHAVLDAIKVVHEDIK